MSDKIPPENHLAFEVVKGSHEIKCSVHFCTIVMDLDEAMRTYKALQKAINLAMGYKLL